MTVQTTINRAFRISQILPSNQTPDSTMSTDALETLNDMLASWSSDYGAPISDGSLSLSDSFPYDGADSRAIAYNLAMELTAEYGAPINQIVAAIADSTLRRLIARYAEISEVEFDDTLLEHRYFNIISE